MSARSNVITAFGSLLVIALSGGPVFAQGCATDVDRLEKVLGESDLGSEERESLSADLDGARQLADSGDDEGCSAAAAKAQAAMLQMEGVDHEALCGRAQSEGEIGEADMSGNQDLQSALQTSCSVEQ